MATDEREERQITEIIIENEPTSCLTSTLNYKLAFKVLLLCWWQHSMQCIAECLVLSSECWPPSGFLSFSLSTFALLSSECRPPSGFFFFPILLYSWGYVTRSTPTFKKKLIYFCRTEWDVNLYIILDLGVIFLQ